MKLKISDIRIDPSVTPRHGLNEETVQRYCEILEDLPPVTVFDIKGKYILADGFHRIKAAKRRGWKEIEADVKKGSLTEAKEYAISANLKHGLSLTPSEYKQAIRMLKYIHPTWGRDRIAKAIERSPTFIEQVLKTDEVRGYCRLEGVAATPSDAILQEVYSAPREQWTPLIKAANKQGWTRDETREKVRQIKTVRSKSGDDKSKRIDKILAPPPDKATDRIASLIRDITRLAGRLDIKQYDFNEARALISLTYRSLDTLGWRTGKMAKDLMAFRKTINGAIPRMPELGSKEFLEAEESERAIELIEAKDIRQATDADE